MAHVKITKPGLNLLQLRGENARLFSWTRGRA